MRRDDLGICLSKTLLSKNMTSTFTHVRAYEVSKSTQQSAEFRVLLAFPQMSGRELLQTMRGSRQLEWRAEFFCPDFY